MQYCYSIQPQAARTEVFQLQLLIGRTPKLNLNNKLLVYNVIQKPAWAYGIQLWGTVNITHIEILQGFQLGTLGTIVHIPRFVPNQAIYRDLIMNSVEVEMKSASEKYYSGINGNVC